MFSPSILNQGHVLHHLSCKYIRVSAHETSDRFTKVAQVALGKSKPTYFIGI